MMLLAVSFGARLGPEPLAFFQLFDLREVLEEHHRPDHAPVVVFDPGQRVANDAAQVLQPDFGAVRQM